MEVQDQSEEEMEVAEQVAMEISRERTLLGLITDIQNGLARRFRERTQHLGISRAQWRVLTMLIGRPGATQTELADLVGIGRAPLGKIIDRLETQGWVERRSDPHDRRINRLYLTRDVSPVVEPTRNISNELVNELLSDLPQEEREAFRRVLINMHQKLGFENGATTAVEEDQGRESALMDGVSRIG